jgi:RimJ/RimL family protein N-acetyltransferase
MEAGRAALTFGFRRVGVDEIISMTTRTNVASQRVMTRLGMSRNPDDDFDYPLLPEDHPLRPHVLYRITKDDWLS